LKTTVGTKINVGEVISKGTDLLRANPSIILIQVLPAIPSLVIDVYSGGSPFGLVPFVAGIISAVLSIIASGAYPPVVREAIQGQRLTIGEALGHAYRRFWSLLAAGILVGLIVFVGFIALLIPGIIFLTWYAYTVPAIMLENKGALEGMSASKAFGRDKKWSTLGIFVVFILVYIVVSIIAAVLSLGLGGRVIQTLLTIPLSAWTSVVIAYTYIAHGPSSTPMPATVGGGGGEGVWQQPPAAPSSPPSSSSSWPGVTGPAPQARVNRFCSFCGAPLESDAKFCANCGRQVQ
jgi:hypothetical protein